MRNNRCSSRGMVQSYHIKKARARNIFHNVAVPQLHFISTAFPPKSIKHGRAGKYGKFCFHFQYSIKPSTHTSKELKLENILGL
jgi:hypothetical protein